MKTKRDMVLDLRGVKTNVAAMMISSIMLFPGDSEYNSRVTWANRQALRYTADLEEKKLKQNQSNEEKKSIRRNLGLEFVEFVSAFEGWQALAFTTRSDEIKKSAAAKIKNIIQKGKIVGLVVAKVLVEKWSLKKASEVVCDRVAGPGMDKILQDQGKEWIRQTSQSFLNHTWPYFKPSAHLWAEYYCHKKILMRAPACRWFNLEQCGGGIQGFVEGAEETRQQAIEYQPYKSSKKSFLSPKESWKIIL